MASGSSQLHLAANSVQPRCRFCGKKTAEHSVVDEMPPCLQVKEKQGVIERIIPEQVGGRTLIKTKAEREAE